MRTLVVAPLLVWWLGGSGDPHPSTLSQVGQAPSAEVAGNSCDLAGARGACRRYFTIGGITHCPPGVRICGEDGVWGDCLAGSVDGGVQDDASDAARDQ